MATTTDARASGFNAADFKDAIRFAMNMGLPDATAERVTFRWTSENTFTTNSPTGNPYDLTATPTVTDSAVDVLVDAAVEFVSRASLGETTSVGSFENPRLVVTLLDDEYATITDATLGLPDKVLVGGNTYNVDFVAPPVGLFSVTVYQIHCTAIDES
jgi:hypothetical protein